MDSVHCTVPLFRVDPEVEGKGLDYEHAVLAVGRLAKFHAVSYAYRYQLHHYKYHILSALFEKFIECSSRNTWPDSQYCRYIHSRVKYRGFLSSPVLIPHRGSDLHWLGLSLLTGDLNPPIRILYTCQRSLCWQTASYFIDFFCIKSSRHSTYN